MVTNAVVNFHLKFPSSYIILKISAARPLSEVPWLGWDEGYPTSIGSSKQCSLLTSSGIQNIDCSNSPSQRVMCSMDATGNTSNNHDNSTNANTNENNNEIMINKFLRKSIKERLYMKISLNKSHICKILFFNTNY